MGTYPCPCHRSLALLLLLILFFILQSEMPPPRPRPDSRACSRRSMEMRWVNSFLLPHPFHIIHLQPHHLSPLPFLHTHTLTRAIANLKFYQMHNYSQPSNLIISLPRIRYLR